MNSIAVIHPDADMHGAHRENTFIALGDHGEYLAVLLLYPFLDEDKEPEHPHNIYLHLHAAQGQVLSETVKDALLEHALRRAAEIKREVSQPKTRVYASFLKGREDQMADFLQRGFARDEGMWILEWRNAAPLPAVETPAGIALRPWTMESETDKLRFIEVHRQVFPRHPYSTERLRALQALPGWANFAAFAGTAIAGNIMLYLHPDHGDTGWIEDLFVGKEWRRQGIGRALLVTALTHLKQRGIDRVQLEHWSANKAALQLYRTFGFMPIDETEIAVGRYV